VAVNLSVDTSSLCIINIAFILNYTMEKRYRLILMTLTFAGCYLSEVKYGWFVLLLRWTLETTNRSAICLYHKGKREKQGSLCSWICQSNAYELNIVTAVTFFFLWWKKSHSYVEFSIDYFQSYIQLCFIFWCSFTR
jgi:hypothetical protein